MSREPIDSLYYYHIYNRGVDKRQVFLDKWDYVRFIESTRGFNRVKPIGSLYRLKKDKQRNPISPEGEIGFLQELQEAPLVDIICYCLNPNHYHLLLRQRMDDGISKFMHKVNLGYTYYFNQKYKRSGALFQGKYKYKSVKSTFDLLKVSVYVNCNAQIHGIAKSENWPWSSYLDYAGIRKGTLCNKNEVLDEFISTELSARPQRYKNYCREWIGDIRKIKYLQKFDVE